MATRKKVKNNEVINEETGEVEELPTPVAVEAANDNEEADSAGMPAPSVDWLTNPTDDTKVKLQEYDQRYMGALSDDQRNMAQRARAHVEDALYKFEGKVDTKSLTFKGHRYTDPREGFPLTGKMVIKITPRADNFPTSALARYLGELASFQGSVDDLVSQVAHDLFIVVRPQKVSVTFSAEEAGATVRSQRTCLWGQGFAK